MRKFKLNEHHIFFIGSVLEGFLYGFYSGIFLMYLHYHASSDKKKNIVFCAICVLYVLTIGQVVADAMSLPITESPGKTMESIVPIQTTLFGCCDSIAQFILIYRCWIVWGCNIRVVIIPLILTFAFLVTWLSTNKLSYSSFVDGVIVAPRWANLLTVSGLALSLIVNALVTGLIVFRILKVFRKVGATSNVHILGPTGGRKLQHAVLVLIESGMALFTIQLIRVVVTIVEGEGIFIAYCIVTPFHNLASGIIPTIILLRTAMGLSFHDEKSMEEFAIGSLNFVFNHSDSIMEMTSSIQENGTDNIGTQRINDIGIAEDGKYGGRSRDHDIRSSLPEYHSSADLNSVRLPCQP